MPSRYAPSADTYATPVNFEEPDIADLSQALRRNIDSARGYQPPIELTAEHLRAKRGVSGGYGLLRST